MKLQSSLPSVDWARRVNRSWIARGHIPEHAEAWLDYLATSSDKRLEHCCENARTMCGIRDRLDDPKPWFYAGLFSLASADEAKRFIAAHRITQAAVPAMADHEDVNLWIDRIGPETRELVDRLRHGISSLPRRTDG